MIKGIDIAAYLVRDPQAQIAFYRDVLGMKPTEIDDQGRGAEFTLADGSTFGVWKPEGGETGGAIMFAVDDAKAAVEHYRARGLKLSATSSSRRSALWRSARIPKGTASSSISARRSASSACRARRDDLVAQRGGLHERRHVRPRKHLEERDLAAWKRHADARLACVLR